MNAFNILKTSEKNIGGITKKTININKKHKGKIDMDEIKKIGQIFINKMKDKHNKDIELVIRGMGILGMRTLKGKNDDIDDILSEEDYLRGRPKHETKFQEFTQLEFSFYYK